MQSGWKQAEGRTKNENQHQSDFPTNNPPPSIFIFKI